MRTLQEEIIERFKVKSKIDPKEEIRISIDFIKDYVKKFPFIETLILGISGGQDSTLLGTLGHMACDELKEEGYDCSFIAVVLPYGKQLDETDVMDALKYINPDKKVEINIKDSVDSLVKEFSNNALEITDFNKGNIKARMRMVAQYMVAGDNKGLVLGSDHPAENLMGYFTKYGDGSADIMPLQRLDKRQMKEMLKELNCPSHLYEKAPTADLEDMRPLLKDEEQMGVSYDDIDDYLEGKEISEKSRSIIEKTYINAEHKRQMPITVFDDFWRR